MKHVMKDLIGTTLVVVGLAATFVNAADAEKLQPVDAVSVKNGALSAVAKGLSFVPTNTVAMPLDIRVMTNMTFTVKEGPPRPLKEGQTLRKDGMLLSLDGSLVPVVDHIAMRNGKPTIVQNGKAEVVTAPKRLANGTRVLPDGTIYDSGGKKTRLLDGQLLKLSGSTIPAIDTVSLNDGKVVVQKDGARIEVPAGRTLMMNDGTKVFSDGRLVYFDGKTRQLTEGETVEIQGVRRNRY